ncbi:MAG TPA: CPBP family intramembrane glutamic endopeptidase [Lacipirellulaceae bacterium]|nr:CPBP family intramembrane glutamic endopeptidase [Lacipirellulaceae bacterium]
MSAIFPQKPPRTMPQDPILIRFVYGTMLTSAALCLYLLSVALRRPLLSYEARRPVPWNAIAMFPIALYLISTAASVWHTLSATSEPPPLKPDEVIFSLVGVIVQQLLIFGGLTAAIAFAFGASWRDMGLPPSFTRIPRDIAIGAIASVAALGPVLLLQAFLANLMGMGEKSGHPLIQMVSHGGPNAIVMGLATITVVVVAPICEELVFRLLFQGWLEKWEDATLGRRVAPASESLDSEHYLLDAENVAASTAPSAELQPSTEPLGRGIAGLPHGWFSILVSAICFGIAHTGYGPEPIPLFFLGLVLGYLFQRTHRVVPCMVAHAIFNLFTMVLLWRMMYLGN